jgi:hypothetical protein
MEYTKFYEKGNFLRQELIADDVEVAVSAI